MRDTLTSTVATLGGQTFRPLEDLLTWIAARDWALALIGEALAERVVVRLLASNRERTVIAALGQVDRLDGWSEVIAVLIDDPRRERLALTALATMPRLDGPYASCALADAIRRRVASALAESDPANALWAVSLATGRWLRLEPTLGRLSLATPDPTRTLADVAERLRTIARAIEASGSLTPELQVQAAALPN